MPPLMILRRVGRSRPGSAPPAPGRARPGPAGSALAPSATAPTRCRAIAALVTACATALGATPGASAAEHRARTGADTRDTYRHAPADTPADRAHRDFLDHGPGISVMTAAHRGQWRKAPENSLAALRAAFADGAEIVEADIRLTKDGVPVLMHDATVDRTTDGTGRVADLSYARLRALRLREGLGGPQAMLTAHRVPTLAEAMRAARTSGLVNLDQAWKDREAVWRVLVETGTVRNGLFKSAAPVPEVRAFRARHPDALYMHLVDDTNAASVTEFGTDRPPAFEVVFDDVGDAVADAAFLRGLRSTGRVWINSMRDALAARYTDEASLIAPARGWATLIGVHGASILQTDNVEELETYLATGVAGAVPPGAVRVQAEDYAPGGEGTGYHDVDAGNRGDGPGRPGEDVDVCDLDGAVAVCWMRGSEWLAYEVDVPQSGRYTLKARVSSPYSPAGTYRVAVDGNAPGPPVTVAGTTSHQAFALQDSGQTRQLTQGRHTLRLSLDEAAFQNWNLDHLQLEPVGT
ncbi:glycerophosphodiester phosphodiesterase family protein [Streptomyces flavofungini]|uniref:glycerophosphodiester phosphodiesterase family protein n=1 Tax=Streptomyces flavofungini TaxID=68200 RepID=UPI0025B17E92|nr:glycerophosphodiester phosphodiesterase family protein [Streptomyces flavofungini]WJV44194.1 glycerophosphodiester phosphodiesterase family protein [Streptomyces flavofungini]